MPEDNSRILSDYITAAKDCKVVNGKKETYVEACDRMLGMHAVKYAAFPEVLRELDRIRPMLHNREIMGSRRAFQFGGEPILKKNARIYNCGFSFCDRPRFFQELFWLLLCGTGCGFSVQKRHVSRLPKVNRGLASAPYVIEDTIEGWADAAGALIGHHLSAEIYPIFDYSQIRSKGAALSSGAGLAPGPGPLRHALEAVDALLTEVPNGTALTPLDCFDIAALLSEAVLSGGVRRSAMIVLFDKDDQALLRAKTGDWWRFAPHRARANISALYLQGEASRDEIDEILTWTRQYGEPGISFQKDLDHGANPCHEIGLRGKTDSGESAWQFCNLATVNVTTCATSLDFDQRVRAATFLATLQAGYTDFPYLGKASEELTRSEALIGVSLCGPRDRPDLVSPALLRNGARVVKIDNAHWARRIAINPAARTTTIKPEGTASLVFGAASGAHARFARRYIRRVRAKKSELVAQHFAALNPHAVVQDETDPDGWVLEFAIESPPNARVQKEQSAIEQLEFGLLLRQHWVLPGRRYGDLDNNVSLTVTVREHEWEGVAEWMHVHQEHLGGVSFMPHDETVYVQPPHEACEPEDPRFLELLEKTVAVEYSDVLHSPEVEQEAACAGGVCELV